MSEPNDSAFARNLRDQMEQGHGRHNSNCDFHGEPFHGLLFYRNQRGRVVGSFGAAGLRAHWTDCLVGDGVEAKRFPEAEEHYVASGHLQYYIGNWVTLISESCDGSPTVETTHLENWWFERVRLQLTNHAGRTLETPFWKRLS